MFEAYDFRAYNYILHVLAFLYFVCLNFFFCFFKRESMLQYGYNRLFIDNDMTHVTFDYSMIGITFIFNTLDSSLNV